MILAQMAAADRGGRTAVATLVGAVLLSVAACDGTAPRPFDVTLEVASVAGPTFAGSDSQPTLSCEATVRARGVGSSQAHQWRGAITRIYRLGKRGAAVAVDTLSESELAAALSAPTIAGNEEVLIRHELESDAPFTAEFALSFDVVPGGAVDTSTVSFDCGPAGSTLSPAVISSVTVSRTDAFPRDSLTVSYLVAAPEGVWKTSVVLDGVCSAEASSAERLVSATTRTVTLHVPPSCPPGIGTIQVHAWSAALDETTVAAGQLTILDPRPATIVFSPAWIEIPRVGATGTFSASVRNAAGTFLDSAVHWSSLNPGIATVTGTGEVRAISAGQTSIMAQSGDVIEYAAIAVLDPDVRPVTSWIPMASGSTGYLTSVWGTSAVNVFVGGGAILHYDGLAWSTSLDQYGFVFGASPADVFKLGNGLWKYDGTSWSRWSMPPRSAFQAYAATPRDIFTTGYDGHRGWWQRFDGSSWLTLSGNYAINAPIAGTNSANVHIAGTDDFLHNFWVRVFRDELPIIDGLTPYVRSVVRGIWVGDATHAVVVADDGMIVHFDGTTLTYPTPVVQVRLNGVWGAAPNDIYAVGSYGTILHFDGTSWTSMDSGTKANLWAVWGTSTDVFVVGESGTILRGIRGP